LKDSEPSGPHPWESLHDNEEEDHFLKDNSEKNDRNRRYLGTGVHTIVANVVQIFSQFGLGKKLLSEAAAAAALANYQGQIYNEKNSKYFSSHKKTEQQQQQQRDQQQHVQLPSAHQQQPRQYEESHHEKPYEDQDIYTEGHRDEGGGGGGGGGDGNGVGAGGGGGKTYEKIEGIKPPPPPPPLQGMSPTNLEKPTAAAAAPPPPPTSIGLDKMSPPPSTKEVQEVCFIKYIFN